MEKLIDFEELLESPGVLIAVERTLLILPGEDVGHPTDVKFILDQNLDDEGCMNGYILDMENNQINTQLFKFKRIDEFFALKSYIVRNAITKR